MLEHSGYSSIMPRLLLKRPRQPIEEWEIRFGLSKQEVQSADSLLVLEEYLQDMQNVFQKTKRSVLSNSGLDYILSSDGQNSPFSSWAVEKL